MTSTNCLVKTEPDEEETKFEDESGFPFSCRYSATKDSEMSRNQHEKVNLNPFVCDYCGKKFKIKSHLSSHLYLHLELENENQVIGKGFQQNQRKLKKVPTSNGAGLEILENYSTSEDEASSEFQSELKIHKESHKFPTARVENSCQYCDLVCDSMKDLIEHEKLHTELVICNFCGAKFTRKVYLEKHLLTHSQIVKSDQQFEKMSNSRKKTKTEGLKPLKCRFCSKTYNSEASRKIHERVHTNPLLCTYCNAAFDTKSHLKDHIKAHLLRTNPYEPIRVKVNDCDKNYECSLCHSSFKTKSGFFTHLQTKHPIDDVFQTENKAGDGDCEWNESHRIKREPSDRSCSASPNEPLETAIALNEIYLETKFERSDEYKCRCGAPFRTLLKLMVHEREKHFNSFKEMVVRSKDLLMKLIEECLTEAVKMEKDDSNSSWQEEDDETWYPETEVIIEESVPEINSDNESSEHNEALDNHEKKGLKVKKSKQVKFGKKSRSKQNNSVSKKSDAERQSDRELKSSIKEQINAGLVCAICFMEFEEQLLLAEHNDRAHSDPSKLFCDICQKKFSHRTTLQNHVLRHQNKRFYCNFCAAKLSSKEDLEKHKKEHEDDPETVCPHCGIGVKGNERLRKHIQRNHKEKPARFFCQACGKGYHYLSGLKDHEIMHNPNPTQLFKCPLCPMEFKRRQALNRHKDIHDESTKRIKCMHCDKLFRRKTHLQAHMKSHTGERSEVCQMCNESFTERRALNRHYERNHGFSLPGYNKRVTK